VADPERAAREWVLDDYRDVLDRTLSCADAVAADGPHRDGPTLAREFETVLDRAGVLDRYPAVLSDAVDAAGFTLAADPVAAPPYVAVTSRGPVLRGTMPAGRLVLTVAAFAVERTSDGVHYRRAGRSPEDAVSVEFFAE
jgi:hypothetical protein